MHYIVSVLIIITCLLLILIVLVQNSKGGGLASNFSSSNQVMGVRKTTDFLEKATWSLAIGLLVLCLVASMTIHGSEGTQNSKIQEQVNNVQLPSVPQLPAQKQNPTGNGNVDANKTTKKTENNNK